MPFPVQPKFLVMISSARFTKKRWAANPRPRNCKQRANFSAIRRRPVAWKLCSGRWPTPATGVDWLAQNEMEVVYDYLHFSSPLRVVIRTRLPRVQPEVPTILEVFPGANWHERETHDFFGIRFLGHPNLKPFLLPEDADFHPLRKDYKP